MQNTSFSLNKPLSSPWFRSLNKPGFIQARWLCFPHAGGAASFFRRWVADVPPGIELIAVQYPGREERIRDPHLTDLQQLAAGISQAFQQHTGLSDKPFLFFGHSMGSMVAYETCRLLQAAGAVLPQHLVVSGCEGPSRHKQGTLHMEGDEVLKHEIRRLGASNELLERHPELLDLVLPAMRSDYQAIETHRVSLDAAMLDMPVTACYGASDPEMDRQDAEVWREVTQHDFALEEYPGEHFYLIDEQVALCQAMTRKLPPAAWMCLP